MSIVATDLTGQRFGRLIVIDYFGNDKKCKCRCDCGAITNVMPGNLKSGLTKSCGCLHKETVRNRLLESPRSPYVIFRKEYEKIHGKLPNGYNVIPLDGDIKNRSDENMYAVKNSIYISLYNNKLLGLCELTKTAAIAYELASKSYKLSKDLIDDIC